VPKVLDGGMAREVASVIFGTLIGLVFFVILPAIAAINAEKTPLEFADCHSFPPRYWRLLLPLIYLVAQAQISHLLIGQ